MNDVLDKIKLSWSLETCYPSLRDKWSPKLPEVGQCVVSALLLQELFGGFIVFNQDYNHYWNILPDREVDLTRKQFGDIRCMTIDGYKEREVFLSNENTRLRYSILKNNFDVL
jgi:hypothetical protein